MQHCERGQYLLLIINVEVCRHRRTCSVAFANVHARKLVSPSVASIDQSRGPISASLSRLCHKKRIRPLKIPRGQIISQRKASLQINYSWELGAIPGSTTWLFLGVPFHSWENHLATGMVLPGMVLLGSVLPGVAEWCSKISRR